MTLCFDIVAVQKTWDGKVMVRLQCELEKGHAGSHTERIDGNIVSWEKAKAN